MIRGIVFLVVHFSISGFLYKLTAFIRSDFKFTNAKNLGYTVTTKTLEKASNFKQSFRFECNALVILLNLQYKSSIIFLILNCDCTRILSLLLVCQYSEEMLHNKCQLSLSIL